MKRFLIALLIALPVLAETKVRNSITLGAAVNVCDKIGSVCPSGGDDTLAIAAAITALPATGGTLYFPPGTYTVTDQFSITKPYTRVVGYGAKLVQNGVLKRGFSASAAGVTIEGFWLFNSRGNTEWADAPAGSTNAIGVYLDTGCDGCKVMNNRIEQWGYTAIRVYQSNNVRIAGNELIGIGVTKPLTSGANNNLGIEGYLSGVGYHGLVITGNFIHDLAQGIYTGYDWQDITISNNVIRDIQGQHGMYLGGAVNLTVTGNTVKTTGQNGIKVQISSDTTLDPENLSIVSNTLDATTGGAAIIVLPATGGLTPRFKQVTIVGNTIRSPGASGISVDQADNFLISDNAIRNATTFGIITGPTSGRGRINGNQILTAQQTGIYAQATSTSFVGSIENNTLDGVCAAGSGTSDVRAVIYMGSGRWIEGNNIIQNDGSCGSDVNIGAGVITTMRRNFPGTKNNLNSGTISAEGFTANTTGSNGVTVTPDIQTTNHLFETVTFATWTVGTPANPDGYATLTITVSNASGGAITTTWTANYKLSAWVDPLNGFNRSITFRRNNNLWYEVSRTPADVAN